MHLVQELDDQLAADRTPSHASALELIKAFKDCDMRLRLAIETGGDSDIRHYGSEVDRCFSAMLAYECDNAEERQTLLRFLVDRFVLQEDTGIEMRRAVCEKLLTAI